MAASWSRLDAGYFGHAKAKAIGKDGRALDLAGICWCATNETDGHIPKHALSFIAGEAEVSPKVVDRVVEMGRWHAVDDGWIVHDYLDYNRSADEIRRERNRWQRNKSRQRAATSQQVSPVDNGEVSPVDNGEVSPVESSVESPRQRNGTERSDLHLRNNSHPRVPEAGEERAQQVVEQYAAISYAKANQSQIRNRARFIESERERALANPALEDYLTRFPTASASAIAGWLHGETQSMRYHEEVPA
jgi:hypothetical protein